MEEEKALATFYIAGVKFHQYKQATPFITEGNDLRLIPEPTNKYDPNAVQIIWESAEKSFMLGYVPKKYSSEISAMLEIERLECILTKYEPSAKTWEMFKVEIRRAQDE